MNQIRIQGGERFLRGPDEQLLWKREFDELGPDEVRRALINARWDSKKRSAARQWLDRSDTLNWKSARPAGGSFMFRLHSAKWWGVAAGIFMGAMMVGRLLRKW